MHSLFPRKFFLIWHEEGRPPRALILGPESVLCEGKRFFIKGWNRQFSRIKKQDQCGMKEFEGFSEPLNLMCLCKSNVYFTSNLHCPGRRNEDTRLLQHLFYDSAKICMYLFHPSYVKYSLGTWAVVRSGLHWQHAALRHVLSPKILESIDVAVP